MLLGSSVKDIAAETNDLRDEIDVRLRQESWKKVLATLTEREQAVIQGFYWKEMNFAEMGRICKVSRERIRQIFEKGLKKLRHPMITKMMREFDLLICETWHPPLPPPERPCVKREYVPPKPHWVKVEFNAGVPRLVADVFYIWQVKPITRKVYDAWIAQALEENEALH